MSGHFFFYLTIKERIFPWLVLVVRHIISCCLQLDVQFLLFFFVQHTAYTVIAFTANNSWREAYVFGSAVWSSVRQSVAVVRPSMHCPCNACLSLTPIPYDVMSHHLVERFQ